MVLFSKLRARGAALAEHGTRFFPSPEQQEQVVDPRVHLSSVTEVPHDTFSPKVIPIFTHPIRICPTHLLRTSPAYFSVVTVNQHPVCRVSWWRCGRDAQKVCSEIVQ